MMQVFRFGQVVEFMYANHRGETKLRRAKIEGVDYGSNVWYPEPQFFLRTFDEDRKDFRSFAFANIVPGSMNIEEA